ncbi:MAG: hypothetical protein KAR18_00580, partial [Spirochaetes bacterium]|nr:hypothetical protein [Spirochaetota bacterium]
PQGIAPDVSIEILILSLCTTHDDNPAQIKSIFYYIRFKTKPLNMRRNALRLLRPTRANVELAPQLGGIPFQRLLGGAVAVVPARPPCNF